MPVHCTKEGSITKSREESSKECNKNYADFKVSPGQVWNCPWSCPSCSGVIIEPVTLPCGHTYCKKCLIKIAKANAKAKTASCVNCGLNWFPSLSKTDHGALELAGLSCDQIPPTVVAAAELLKVNVLVNRLCDKYWGPALEAVKLRLDANTNFARGNLQHAVDIYSNAIDLGKDYRKINMNKHGLFIAER